MNDGVLLSKWTGWRIVAGLAAIGALALNIPARAQNRPHGAIPQDLRPGESIAGTLWVGSPAVVVRVADLDARTRDTGPQVGLGLGTAFDGPTSADSPFLLPDSTGAAGPNQIMVAANGRIEIFTKSGTLVSSFTDTSLFAPVTSNTVSHPRVRYDRTSGRWFLTEIEESNTSNKLLVAVSSGSDISAASSFNVYGFAHDAPGGGGIDTGHFADFDTLGVDANALYVGTNELTNFASGVFQDTSVYVIRKSSVVSGGSIVVTAFRGLTTGAGGAFTPQGVQNDDAAATVGYFIGIDRALTGLLDIYRVSTPGATPSLSGVMNVTVPSTANPIAQPAGGSLLPLDTLDARLSAAELRTNRITGVQTLWTAHTILVDSSGVGSASGSWNGSRWYEIGSLATTPALVQSGTVFASNSSFGFWVPSIDMNGQGHAAIAMSVASTSFNQELLIGLAGRLSSDAAGTMASPLPIRISSTAAYNRQTTANCGCTRQRWGDYSQTVVDPNDDMTMWTFQEYASAVDTWAVRVSKITAPPPAAPSTASPSTLPKTTSATVTITGTSVSGSGFFDPGPGFPNHIAVTLTNSVIVNSVTVVDATHLQLSVNTSQAVPGSVNVTVTNPDGGVRTGTALFAVASPVFGGDFDADNKSDMTLYQPDGTWRILKSTSGYTAATSVNWGGAGYVPVPGDYDGDGKLDPAVYNTSTGQWLALKSSTNYTTTFSQSWGGIGYLPEPGDYDGDGKIDPAVYVQATGQWSILKSSGGYTTTISANWGGAGYTPIPGRDFDGDARADIGVYQAATGAWYILKSSTGFAGTLSFNWGGGGYTLVPGDYDGDGKADAGLYEGSTGNWYVLLSGAGFTTTLVKSWGGSGYDPVPGDYDGDNKFDLAIVQRSTGNWYVLRSLGGFTTSFSVTGWGASTDTLVSGAIIPGGITDARRATDVDGDGKADITVYSSAGQWLALKSSTGYTTTLNKNWGGAGYTPAPGDFDGDGQVDSAIYQNATGNWFVLLSGAGFTTTLNKSAGGANYVPVVGDYDGDGKSDFAVYNTATGNWYILKSSTNYTTTLSVNWGGTGYAPALGDYDGDGRADLAVYQQSSGNWYVLLSSSNYASSFTINAGEPGYVAVPGDYDGDGKTDFVVYNTTTGLWFGLKSSTNYTTTVNKSWGGPGYTPVRGDFDGDGKADLALYQPSTGNWLVLLSGSGYTTTLSKSWGGPGYSATPTYPS